MYVGHVGIALGLRRVPGAPSLALLVLAAQGPDWADTLWALAGALSDGRVGGLAGEPGWLPHGLPWLAVGAAVSAALAARARGARGAALGAIAYLSHWGADFVTGIKPTWPGGPIVGLLLYSRPMLDFLLEVAVLAIGWTLWRGTLPVGNRAGRRRALVTTLVLVALAALQGLGDAVMAGRTALR